MKQLEKIDVLRGVAILLVFGFHSLIGIFGDFEIEAYKGFWYDSSHTSPSQLALNLNPVGLGHVGVKLFLIISGFLIHWGYLRGGGRFEPAKFYNKRFWRIYPPYLVALLLFAVTLGTAGGAFSLLTHLTLTHNFFKSTNFSINPSFWSLALEMQLYLIYPLYLVLYKRLGLQNSVLIVGLVALAAIEVQLATGVRTDTSIFKMWFVWVLGAYLGENYFHKRRLYTGKGIYLALGYAVYIFLSATVLSPYLGDVLFSVLAIYGIDWYLHTENAFPFFPKKVANWLAVIGVYSYSIYLFHQPFLKKLIQFFSFNFASKLWCALGTGLAFGVIFGVAYLSYQVLELDSIKYGNRFFENFLARYSGTKAND